MTIVSYGEAYRVAHSGQVGAHKLFVCVTFVGVAAQKSARPAVTTTECNLFWYDAQ